jgi:hypothetical protein
MNRLRALTEKRRTLRRFSFVPPDQVRSGVTLCGFVRDGRMAIYTEPRTCTATRRE